MSRTVFWIFAILITFMPMQPSCGQTAADINKLLKKSTLVDTGRDVNSTVDASKTTISTYCNPKATNQDCKATALLMMKELNQHYKNIHRIDVRFFDPANNRHYREVEIREGDALLVDQGKPLPEVLSQIDVADRTLQTASVPQTRATTALQSRTGAGAQGGFASYRNGDVSFLYPRDWRLDTSGAGGSMVRIISKSGKREASIALFRHPELDGTPLDLASKLVQAGHESLPNYRKLQYEEINTHGLSGIYLEESFDNLGGAVRVRAALVKSQSGAVYILMMNSTGTNETEMNTLFQKSLSSLNLR